MNCCIYRAQYSHIGFGSIDSEGKSLAKCWLVYWKINKGAPSSISNCYLEFQWGNESFDAVLTVYNNQMDHAYPPLFLLDAYTTSPQLTLTAPQAPHNLIWQLSEQYKAVVQLNYQLQLKLSMERAQNLALTEQNRQLRDRMEQGTTQTKRKYSKRRTWLQKKYKCHHLHCNSCYSSRIALNLHLRKRHPRGTSES